MKYAALLIIGLLLLSPVVFAAQTIIKTTCNEGTTCYDNGGFFGFFRKYILAECTRSPIKYDSSSREFDTPGACVKECIEIDDCISKVKIAYEPSDPTSWDQVEITSEYNEEFDIAGHYILAIIEDTNAQKSRYEKPVSMDKKFNFKINSDGSEAGKKLQVY